MKFNISKRAKEDFEFYKTSTLDMIGHQIGEQTTKEDPNGYSALECFYSLDTYGKEIPCRELTVLNKVIRSKKSINLQIEMWAEDVAGGLLFQHELVEYTINYPSWVIKDVMNQASKIAQKQIGFAPRFARGEYVKGSLWYPYMDTFDACI